MGNSITMEEVRFLYIMDGLKMEQLNNAIINLDEIYVMSIINISLIILILFLEYWLI